MEGFCAGKVEMAVTGISQEGHEPSDPIQRMPAGMEEGPGPDRSFLDLLFQRANVSIKNRDEKSHLTQVPPSPAHSMTATLKAALLNRGQFGMWQHFPAISRNAPKGWQCPQGRPESLHLVL